MGYTLRTYGIGEDIAYSDSSGELWLQMSYNRVRRFYCRDTEKLPLGRRKEVVENLCDYFQTRLEPSVFVLDERDKDRKELEDLFARLVGEDHKITVEYDSAEKREHFEDTMYLQVLRAGKKLVLDGVELGTEAEYWQWKQKAQQKCASPTDGPRWWLAIRAFWKGRHG